MKINLKTTWPNQVAPNMQVRRVLNALAATIGPDAIKGLVSFVHYTDEDGVEQRAVFSGGEGLDSVIQWAAATLKESQES